MTTQQNQDRDLEEFGGSLIDAAETEKIFGVQDAETTDSDEVIDEKKRVMNRVLNAHEVWFDVTRDYEYLGQHFEGYAEFHSLGEKYVLTKRAKLWEVEAHEYVFFDVVDELDEATFARYLEFMKTQAVNKVEPGPNHMSSYISLVLVADRITPEAGKALAKTSYHKSFKFGFQGWAEYRLCALDLASQQVITNAMGKKMKTSLEESAGFVAPGTRKRFRRR